MRSVQEEKLKNAKFVGFACFFITLIPVLGFFYGVLTNH